MNWRVAVVLAALAALLVLVYFNFLAPPKLYGEHALITSTEITSHSSSVSLSVAPQSASATSAPRVSCAARRTTAAVPERSADAVKGNLTSSNVQPPILAAAPAYANDTSRPYCTGWDLGPGVWAAENYYPERCRLHPYNHAEMEQCLVAQKVRVVMYGDSVMDQFGWMFPVPMRTLVWGTGIHGRANKDSRMLMDLLSIGAAFRQDHANWTQIFIMNYGAHYQDDQRNELREDLIWMEDHVRNTWDPDGRCLNRFVWREYSPSHFNRTGYPRGEFSTSVGPTCIPLNVSDMRHDNFRVDMANKIFLDKGWEFWPMFARESARYDDHPPKHPKSKSLDCRHWNLLPLAGGPVYNLWATTLYNVLCPESVRIALSFPAP